MLLVVDVEGDEEVVEGLVPALQLVHTVLQEPDTLAHHCNIMLIKEIRKITKNKNF